MTEPTSSSPDLFEQLSTQISALENLYYSKKGPEKLNPVINNIFQIYNKIISLGYFRGSKVINLEASKLLASKSLDNEYIASYAIFITNARQIVQDANKKNIPITKSQLKVTPALEIEEEIKQAADQQPQPLSPKQANIYRSLTESQEVNTTLKPSKKVGDILKATYCKDFEELKRRFKNQTKQEELSRELKTDVLYLSRGESPKRLLQIIKYGNVGGIPPEDPDVELTERAIIDQLSDDMRGGSKVPEFSKLWQAGQFSRGNVLIIAIIDNSKRKARTGSNAPGEQGVLLDPKTPLDVEHVFWMVGEDLVGVTDQPSPEDRRAKQLEIIRLANEKLANDKIKQKQTDIKETDENKPPSGSTS